MIEIISKPGQFCPVVICDICGRQIEAPDRGHVCFEYDAETDQVAQVQFIHKKCDICHWQTQSTLWMPLEEFFEYLLFNIFHWGAVYVGDHSLVQQQREYYSLEAIPYRTRGVYLVHSQEEIVYIGQSKNVRDRLSNYKHPVVRAGIQIEKIIILPINEVEQRLNVEAMLISTLQPPLNQKRRVRLVV